MERERPKMPKLEGAYYRPTPKAMVGEVLVGDIFIHVPSNEELIVSKTEVCYDGPFDKRGIHYMRFVNSQQSAAAAWTADLLDPTKFQYVGHQD
jgi:hypothetical protein